jgi:hypothetical protein
MSMKRSDWILIIVIVIVALVSYLFLYHQTQSSTVEDGYAVVYYNDERILKINLINGEYEILNDERVLSADSDDGLYHVLGSNPYGVYIKYEDHRVRVIDEVSPKHICQIQGWTNSPLQPLTCLPNNIMIIIEANRDDLPDDITG